MEKVELHIRNKHRSNYDFQALIKSSPELQSFIGPNKYGNESIDFSNPEAVKALNKALLLYFYQIEHWDIPEGFLCPPIPGRADYIHYAADLLASVNNQIIPKGKKVKVLDIGVGANCVYPIIGHQEYGWQFVGAEIDKVAVKAAQNIVEINSPLRNSIEIRWQSSPLLVFNNIIGKTERFDLTICNPPFHASAQEANAGSERKSRNLGQKNTVLNFGGKNNELWTSGGEVGFIGRMIEESRNFKNQCFWFTSLVSKSENLSSIYAMLKRADVVDVRTSELAAGNKITRIVAWTFLTVEQQKNWVIGGSPV